MSNISLSTDLSKIALLKGTAFAVKKSV